MYLFLWQKCVAIVFCFGKPNPTSHSPRGTGKTKTAQTTMPCLLVAKAQWHAHIRTVQWCILKLHVQGSFVFTEEIKTEVKDRLGGRWGTMFNSFCLVFFLVFAYFTCTRASCKNSAAFTLYYIHIKLDVEKPEQTWIIWGFQVHQTSVLTCWHWVYLLDGVLKH